MGLLTFVGIMTFITWVLSCVIVLKTGQENEVWVTRKGNFDYENFWGFSGFVVIVSIPFWICAFTLPIITACVVVAVFIVWLIYRVMIWKFTPTTSQAVQFQGWIDKFKK